MREKIYNLLRRVPKGKVTTYKALANAMGTNAYRVIGHYMKTNPHAPQVPCHRVVKSDGTIGGFNGMVKGSEIERKIEMLKDEGIEFEGDKIKDFEKRMFWF